MSNNIDTRSSFFPKNKGAQKSKAAKQASLQRNSYERAQEIKSKTSNHAKVDIPDAIKDYSKIKRLADNSQPSDKADKIAALKAQIQNGNYQMDFDAIAEKMLGSEF